MLLRPFTRLRHHCRLCGLIFCDACCRLRAMLPPKFQLKEPQRVCTTCAQLLEPLQPFLAGERPGRVCARLFPAVSLSAVLAVLRITPACMRVAGW